SRLKEKKREFMREYKFWEKLILHISDEDFDFLCRKRFFTYSPTFEDVRIEFVTGTGITYQKSELWGEADQLFHEYILDLKGIMDEREE
ncbi:MAG: hypothetical protein K6B44_01020, partial [Lachnospiraceae bacterium]|nr:hypothetical protein [Lachnospiraceae bacterium]